MIQRVQSLYLLVATILLTIMIFSPLATLPLADGEIVVKPFSIGEDLTQSFSQVAGISYLSILLIITTILPFFAIFFYRKRLFQAKLVTITIILAIGLQLFACYSLYNITKFADQITANSLASIIDVSYSITALFPFIAAILAYLAFRGVIKDEMLIKSLDRLR